MSLESSLQIKAHWAWVKISYIDKNDPDYREKFNVLNRVVADYYDFVNYKILKIILRGEEQ